MKHINDVDITRTHDLTIEEVKALPMFAHFTDEEAEEALQTIKTFVEIALDRYMKEKQKSNMEELSDHV